VEGGVTSIEHGTYMDDEIIGLLKQHGTWYVPTITAGRFVADKAKVPGYFPEIVRPKAERIGAQIHETFARAYKAGVRIGFGTDMGVAPHGASDLGQLEPGFRADVVAVQGNPLDNIALTRQVSFVMKDGAVYRQPSVPHRDDVTDAG